MNRLMLAIALPLGAALAVGIIGIGFGLLFLETDSRYGHDLPVIVALAVTVIVMAVAGVLHQRAVKNEGHLVNTGVPVMGGKIDRPGDPTDKGPEDPTQAARRRARSRDRKK